MAHGMVAMLRKGQPAEKKLNITVQKYACLITSHRSEVLGCERNFSSPHVLWVFLLIMSHWEVSISEMMPLNTVLLQKHCWRTSYEGVSGLAGALQTFNN